jgi:hypothetical protein
MSNTNELIILFNHLLSMVKKLEDRVERLEYDRNTLETDGGKF